MKMMCACGGLSLLAVLAVGDATGDPQWKTPLIQMAGKIVVLPVASVQPVADSKAVFDATTQKDAGRQAEGLVKAARWLNLNAAAGIDPERIHLTVVLHGDATKAALEDAAYARFTEEEENPNLGLVRELKEAGVELYVCGQALAHRRYPQSAVIRDVKVATAALTVLVDKQQAGYSYLPD